MTAVKAGFRTAAGRAVHISAAVKAAFRTVAEMAVAVRNGAKADAGISAAIQIVKGFPGVNAVRTVVTVKNAVHTVVTVKNAARTIVTGTNAVRTVAAVMNAGKVSGANGADFQTAPPTVRVRNILKIPPSLMKL